MTLQLNEFIGMDHKINVHFNFFVYVLVFGIVHTRFRINVFCEIEFCILMDIVNRVFIIYSFEVFSQIQDKNFRTSWFFIFRML